ncbi:MAG: hypothetical protein RSE94_21970, partial [Pseudomonas sp.]
YMGSIPWVVMQVILVAIVIFFPQTVTVFLDKEVVVDLDKVQLEMPADMQQGNPIDLDAPLLIPGETPAADANAPAAPTAPAAPAQ